MYKRRRAGRSCIAGSQFERGNGMAFLDDFLARVDTLPYELYCKYTLMQNLDKTLQALQRKNEHRCEREIEEIRRGVESGNITPDTSHIRFSNEALDEQKRCLTIADEKVSLAQKTYNMVDSHIQELDKYLRKFDEDLRRDRELTGAPGSEQNPSSGNSSGKGSKANRGRKKSRLSAEVPSMDLEVPVDPNEPTYCVCNQVSYGEMVACDNPDCKIEWFHFGCVGLSEQPKGKWYCTVCAVGQKRRKGR